MKIPLSVRLLLVEDDPRISSVIARSLGRLGMEVVVASDGREGFDAYGRTLPDLIITDLSMPVCNGAAMVEQIRRVDPEIPIIVLTAHDETDYLKRLVELNIRRYLNKPCPTKILHEAIEAALIDTVFRKKDELHLGEGFRFCLRQKRLFQGAQEVPLSTKERLFLSALAEQRERFLSYAQIEQRVWQGEYMSPGALRTLVKSLRKKSFPEIVRNLSGLGYALYRGDKPSDSTRSRPLSLAR